MTRLVRVLLAAVSGALAACATFVPDTFCVSDQECPAEDVCGDTGICRPPNPEDAVEPTDEPELVLELTSIRLLSPDLLEATLTVPSISPGEPIRIGICAQPSDPDDAAEICQTVTTTEPTTRLRAGGLSPSVRYAVRPIAATPGVLPLTEQLYIRTPPAQVTGVVASDGVSSVGVEVRWTAVPGTRRYLVYRDDLLVGLTESPQFVDTEATGGGPPAAVVGLTASQGTRSDGVALSWEPAGVTPGELHIYQVAAAGPGGLGPRSASDSGFRAPFPVFAHTIRMSDARVLPVGAATEFLDEFAPLGDLLLSGATASQGEFAGIIEVQFTSSTAIPGADIVYEVQAENAAGSGPSSTIVGHRSAPDPAVSWFQWRGDSQTGTWVELDARGTSFTVATPNGQPTAFLARWRQQDQQLEQTARGWAAECLSTADCGALEECIVGLCAPVGYARIPANALFLGPASRAEPGHERHDLVFGAEFTRDRLIGRFEVTQLEWEQVMGTRPARFAACGDGCPIENVTWGSALAYANALSIMDGLAPCYDLQSCSGDATTGSLHCDTNPALQDAVDSVLNCEGWRLPTELEWEWASKGFVNGAHWIETPAVTDCTTDPGTHGLWARSCCSSAVSWNGCATDVPDRTCAGPAHVGMLGANPWGLHDVLGNVAEFTWGRRGPALWNDVTVVDPELPTSGGDLVVKGGSFRSIPTDTRTAERRFVPSNWRSDDVGFRVIRTLP